MLCVSLECGHFGAHTLSVCFSSALSPTGKLHSASSVADDKRWPSGRTDVLVCRHGFGFCVPLGRALLLVCGEQLLRNFGPTFAQANGPLLHTLAARCCSAQPLVHLRPLQATSNALELSSGPFMLASCTSAAILLHPLAENCSKIQIGAALPQRVIKHEQFSQQLQSLIDHLAPIMIAKCAPMARSSKSGQLAVQLRPVSDH